MNFFKPALMMAAAAISLLSRGFGFGGRSIDALNTAMMGDELVRMGGMGGRQYYGAIDPGGRSAHRRWKKARASGHHNFRQELRRKS